MARVPTLGGEGHRRQRQGGDTHEGRVPTFSAGSGG